MAKYVKNPVVVEAITFDELVEYGKANTANIVNGMPWSFHYKGCPVSHENDKCYLITTLGDFSTLRVTPSDMLICDGSELSVVSIDEFKHHYTFCI